MVDAFIMQSEHSNSAEDTEKFQMTLTSLMDRGIHTTRKASSPFAKDEIDEDTQCQTSQPLPPVPDNVQLDNVLFYIAGSVAFKLQEKVCSNWWCSFKHRPKTAVHMASW